MAARPGRTGHGNDIVSGIRLVAIACFVAFDSSATLGSFRNYLRIALHNGLHIVHGASSSSLTPLYLLHVKIGGTYGRATMDDKNFCVLVFPNVRFRGIIIQSTSFLY